MAENDLTTPEDASTDIESRVLRDPRLSGQFPSGHRIGRYIIREVLGEGGFAVVYLADQTEPVRRRVALKVIKLGMDTKQVLARFEAERQALAMMDHPNVAKVFDAGVSDDGRSYFVMEHVPGVPITDHCDRQRLNIEQRLALFTQVCDAVQHAHQKGIIHRDLKPTNVLVSAKEGSAVPKVIDFGVAKALHQKLTEKTLFTEQGQLIGTPEYMSPEQAEMTAQDIDTRSDIYSLGVLLYELLTGALPFDPKSLRKAAFGEIQRIIREEEPPKPSTRLSSLSLVEEGRGEGESSVDDIAQHRRADARSLIRELRGDLDWIVMKALEKDRTRRYSSASEFAADIARHLNDEPVIASPPGAWYRARKRLRKRRGLYSAVCAVLAAIAFTVTQFMVQEDRVAQEAQISRNYADELAESKRQAGLLADIAQELGMRRGRMLEGLLDRLAAPPASPAEFASDETIAEAVIWLNRFFFVRFWGFDREFHVPKPNSQGPWPVRRLSTFPEDLQAAVRLDSPAEVAAELERSSPDRFEQAAKAYLELAIETVRGSIDVPATGALIDSVGSLLTRTPVADDYWPILNKRQQELLSLTHGLSDSLRERWADATLRPKDMALEELVSADMFVRTRLAMGGFMADLRFDFPWYWNLKLLALAILAAVFSLSAVAIRFFV